MIAKRIVTIAVLIAASLELSAGRGAAQDTAGPAGAGLQVQRLESGVVVAPDVVLTEVNGQQATLAGGYIGWLTDRTLLVGAAGYVLANRDDDFKMQYGGGLARWTFFSRRALAVSTGVLAGFGDATLALPYGEVFGPPRTSLLPAPSGRDGRIRFGGGASSITAETPVRISERFLVAEPQVHAVWTIAPWLRVNVGGGYRFIGGADWLGDELRGPSGSLALQFGR